MILCILEDADDDVDSFDAFVPHLYSLNGKTKNNNQIKRLMIEIEGSQKKKETIKMAVDVVSEAYK